MIKSVATQYSHTFHPNAWIGRDGEPLACAEKVKLLNDNLAEIQALCQRALEEAVDAGCSEHFMRIVLTEMVSSLEKPYSRNGSNGNHA